MTNSTKMYVYSTILLLYLAVMIALPLNFFVVLIIVPFVASGWAVVILAQFLVGRKKFMDDIESDKTANWEDDNTYLAKWEEEPKDLEWKFHTVICVGWPIYYFGMLILGLLMRSGSTF